MTERRSRYLGLTILGLAIALQAGLAVLLWLTHNTGWQPAPGEVTNAFKPSDLLQGFPAVIIGAIIIWKRPGNRLGWVAAAAGISFIAVDFCYQYAVYALAANPGSLPSGHLFAWLDNWIWAPAPGSLAFLFLLFPDGKPPSPRWRPVVWAAALVNVLLFVTPAFLPAPTGVPAALDNSYHLTGLAKTILSAAYGVTFPLLAVLILTGGISLVWRFHCSTGDERLQIKWVAFTGAIAVILYAANQLMTALPIKHHTAIVGNLSTLALIALEAVIGLAILKYHLYDIDLIIRRTMVYGSLMVSLAAVYIGSILLLEHLLSPITGQSDLAIALSTLAAAALFQPLRHRIQAIVDRRFYRQRYDAEQALAHFGAAARDEVDLEHLTSTLIHVIGETIQPEHVSLWLRSAEESTS